VLEGASGVVLEAGHTTGDSLLSMLLGTRRALGEAHRQSLTLALDRLDARTLGAVVALFERAVGFYGSMIGINAYHQPGVEAGKQAADRALEQLAQLRRGERLPEGDDTELLLAHQAAREAETTGLTD
jgi:glucose-6-phosphate isomerase